MSKYVIEFDGYIPKTIEPIEQALEEAYYEGLCDGNTRNEDGCVGCKYDNVRIDRSPCIYCCNAYSNQWMAKEKSDEIKVGDIITDGKINYLVIDITDKSYIALQGTDFEPAYIGKDYIKSYHNLHDSKDMRKIAEEISKAMKGEQRNCSTCKHLRVNSIECTECCWSKGYNRWQPKGDAE